jgi:glycosyltransferase involved in cell wall biosynthesis
MKRAIIFSTAYAPFIGGAEIAVEQIATRFPDVQWHVITARMSANLPQKETHGNITVHRMGTGAFLDKLKLMFFGHRYAALLGPCEVVWAMMASYAGFAATKYKKEHPDTRYVLTLQEGDSKAHIYARSWPVWLWFLNIFRRADHIQAISTYLQSWARSLGAHCPITIVPNGVDIPLFDRIGAESTQGRAQRERIRTAHRIPDSARIIVTTSRLVKKNGVDFLINAMKHLPEHVHLLIVGDGPRKQEYHRLAQGLSLAERIHFVGKVSYKDIPPHLWASDVFCRPSRSEGLGNSFLEAMVAGIPVIGTRVGGIPDIIDDGRTGLFCEHDPDDIAAKIRMLLDAPSFAEKLSDTAYRTAAAAYDWESIAKQMRRVLFSV